MGPALPIGMLPSSLKPYALKKRSTVAWKIVRSMSEPSQCHVSSSLLIMGQDAWQLTDALSQLDDMDTVLARSV